MTERERERRLRELEEEKRRAAVHQGQVVWTLAVATGVAMLALYQLTLPKTPLKAGALTGLPVRPLEFQSSSGPYAGVRPLDNAPGQKGSRAPASVGATPEAAQQ